MIEAPRVQIPSLRDDHLGGREFTRTHRRTNIQPEGERKELTFLPPKIQVVIIYIMPPLFQSPYRIPLVNSSVCLSRCSLPVGRWV